MGFSKSYIGVPMLYLVFAFWAGATIAVMGGCHCQQSTHVNSHCIVMIWLQC